MARVLLNRLIPTIAQEDRGTADMIFMLRKIQQKCKEYNMELLYAAFVDLTKAFNTVSRDVLLKILHDKRTVLLRSASMASTLTQWNT